MKPRQDGKTALATSGRHCETCQLSKNIKRCEKAGPFPRQTPRTKHPPSSSPCHEHADLLSFLLYAVPETGPRTSNMLGKPSMPEPYLSPVLTLLSPLFSKGLSLDLDFQHDTTWFFSPYLPLDRLCSGLHNFPREVHDHLRSVPFSRRCCCSFSSGGFLFVFRFWQLNYHVLPRGFACLHFIQHYQSTDVCTS